MNSDLIIRSCGNKKEKRYIALITYRSISNSPIVISDSHSSSLGNSGRWAEQSIASIVEVPEMIGSSPASLQVRLSERQAGSKQQAEHQESFHSDAEDGDQ